MPFICQDYKGQQKKGKYGIERWNGLQGEFPCLWARSVGIDIQGCGNHCVEGLLNLCCICHYDLAYLDIIHQHFYGDEEFPVQHKYDE